MNKEDALKQIESSRKQCMNIQPKFQEGSAQHSLLKNRIQALNVIKLLIQEEHIDTKEEIEQAIPPIASIIHKCQKASAKQKEGSATQKRLQRMIEAMELGMEYLKEYQKEK